MELTDTVYDLEYLSLYIVPFHKWPIVGLHVSIEERDTKTLMIQVSRSKINSVYARIAVKFWLSHTALKELA